MKGFGHLLITHIESGTDQFPTVKIIFHSWFRNTWGPPGSRWNLGEIWVTFSHAAITFPTRRKGNEGMKCYLHMTAERIVDLQITILAGLHKCQYVLYLDILFIICLQLCFLFLSFSSKPKSTLRIWKLSVNTSLHSC